MQGLFSWQQHFLHQSYQETPGWSRMNRINYHVAFAELKEALRRQKKVENVKGKEKRAEDAAKSLLAATDIYKDEEARSKAVLPHLKNVLQKTMIGRSRKEFEMDPMVIESINDVSYERK
jgi:hypothetical protein